MVVIVPQSCTGPFVVKAGKDVATSWSRVTCLQVIYSGPRLGTAICRPSVGATLRLCPMGQRVGGIDGVRDSLDDIALGTG